MDLTVPFTMYDDDATIIELGDETTSCPSRRCPEMYRSSPQDDEDGDEGKHFGSVRPWAGNMQPPDNWNPATFNPRVPDIKLELDYVYGYRSRQAHNNVHWVEAPTTIVYHSAAVCVVGNIVTRTQTYFLGHEDDVLCLDYNKERRICASGGLGKRSTAPILIWSVDDMSLKTTIKGTLQFGVLAVAFSLDGSRVFGVGADPSHTVAVFDTNTGICLASLNGDKNRIVHIITDTTIGRDSKRNFVTVGVSHVKFWQKLKNKEEFAGKKAIGGDISSQTMTSACCTLQHVIVGNVSGNIYVFTDGTLVRTIDAHGSFCGALTSDYNTVYSGGRDGLIKTWNFELPNGKCTEAIDLNPHSYCSSDKMLVDGKMKKRGNGARSISVSGKYLLVGTQFASMYVIDGPESIQPILEGHFEEAGSSMPELWGLDVHPTEPMFCSAGDDATLRLWSLDLGSMILMTNCAYPSRACGFSPDGSSIAVGHENGAFSVWDSMTLVPLVSFTRKRQHKVADIKYSPDGRWLALSMGQGNLVDIYDVKNGYTFVSYCDAVSSTVRRIDWSTNSRFLQCATSAYELIVFNVPDGSVNQASEMCNVTWESQSGTIGWGVQGIWADCSDGTDVNVCARSHNGQYLVAGYDFCRLRAFNYPCLPRSLPDNPTRIVFPGHREFVGHSSHVTAVKWSPDDQYVLTAGGMDLTILRWKVVPLNQHHALSLTDTANLHAQPTSVADAVATGKITEIGKPPPSSTGKMGEKIVRPVGLRANSIKPGVGNGGGASRPSSTVGGSMNSYDEVDKAKSTMRKPYSNNDAIPSRLLQTTASASIKTKSALAHRAHINKYHTGPQSGGFY